MSDGPLDKQIVTSIEDVKALLESNRKLSVAYLSRKQRDLEESTRERFREKDKEISALRASVATLKERLDTAGVVVKELRIDVDALKNEE